jgi:hypothetical protein
MECPHSPPTSDRAFYIMYFCYWNWEQKVPREEVSKREEASIWPLGTELEMSEKKFRTH